jgi:hypothetical protein
MIFWNAAATRKELQHLLAPTKITEQRTISKDQKAYLYKGQVSLVRPKLTHIFTSLFSIDFTQPTCNIPLITVTFFFESHSYNFLLTYYKL